MVRLSVIIPVYNVAPYLRDCLDSVLAQTFENWEAVCVDDGSTDGSGAILDEYAARDPRFRVIRQENVGVSEARQRGLEAVRGTYFGFVDPDDWIDPDMYGTLIRAAEEGGADYLWENICPDSARGVGAKSQRCDGDNWTLIDSLLIGELSATLWSRLFRTEFVRANGLRFLPGRITICEDLCFICEVLACGARTQFVDAAHYHYRDVGTSVTHRQNLRNVTSWKIAGDRLLDLLGGTPSREAVLSFRRKCRETVFLYPFVDDRTFADFFPEARTPSPDMGRARGLLYWLSIHGCRRGVMALANAVRKLKGVKYE